MALSATRQFGDPSTHFIPYLVKAGSLHRVARKSGKGSVLEHYFETCYGQSYRPRYRFLLQALHTNRLILLIDATDQKDNKQKAVEAFNGLRAECAALLKQAAGLTAPDNSNVGGALQAAFPQLPPL